MRKWVKIPKRKRSIEIRELMRDMVLILANTGMRAGTESNNLKWKDIKEVKQDGDTYLEFTVNGKTGKRKLIARDNVKTPLERIQERFPELKQLTFQELIKRNEIVFRQRNGKQLRDPHGAFRELLIFCNLLNVDDEGKYIKNELTLYSLRHTYATFQILNGIDIYKLAKNMGTSVLMIERHYGHLEPRLIAKELSGRQRKYIQAVKI
jgi:integrase